MSSFAVIAMVLVASVTIPVKAVTDIYYLKDNIVRSQIEGTDQIVTYLFDTAPYLSVLNQGTGYTASGYDEVNVTDLKASTPYAFRVYPLGNSFVPGRDITSGVLDISDFKSKAYIELSASLEFNVQYLYNYNVAGLTNFYFLSYAYLCFYDADGKFISELTTDLMRTDITINEFGASGDSGSDSDVIVDVDFNLTIPENAVYMAPCILSYFYPPSDSTHHTLTLMTGASKGLYISASKNLLLDHSETLDALERLFEKLNDKTDTLIHGTEEQNKVAQDAHEEYLDFRDEAERTHQSEQEYLDSYDEASDDLNKDIFEFANGEGFTLLSSMLSPIMEWEHTRTLLMLFVAFVNLSIIMFGR